MKAVDTIRVLVVDDEAPVRDAYEELLGARPTTATKTELERLRVRLFASDDDKAPVAPDFEVHTANGAEAAVNMVQASLEKGQNFDVVFLDMRMPPGPDGAWAASAIRKLDPNIHMVIVTAYSDFDPAELSTRIPPAERLLYLQKPFHAHEVRQLAVALGRNARIEAHVRRLAYFDPLTGLPNRTMMREHMAEAIATAKQHSRNMAVFFIDLDNFKRINDTLGHSVGDEVLQAMANCLRNSMRGPGTAMRLPDRLGRMGGDEFLMLLPDISEPTDTDIIGERIAKALASPVRAGGHELFLTASIGVAVFPNDGDEIESLLRNADLAMYFAKREGRANLQYYDAQMNATALKRLTLESQLRGALARNEFSLHYQPQVDVKSGRVCGMEALLRWNNVELGNVPPQEFISVAEDSGLINVIGDWVLHAACVQAAAWIDAGLPMERIAVNVSPVQLVQPNFIDRVAHALQESGLEPNVLELELTEGALIANFEHARELLGRLKALNVQIAIDDFGVGYAGMKYLKELSVNRVKIDRSFICNIDTVKKDRTIAAAIIAMAQGMDLSVTAEGVEDQMQVVILDLHNCNEIQGYYVSRPMPADQAAAYLDVRVSPRVAAG